MSSVSKYAFHRSTTHVVSTQVVAKSAVLECVLLESNTVGGVIPSTQKILTIMNVKVMGIISATAGVEYSSAHVVLPPVSSNKKTPIDVSNCKSIHIDVGSVVEMSIFVPATQRLSNRHNVYRLTCVNGVYEDKTTGVLKSGIKVDQMDVRVDLDSDKCSDFFLYYLMQEMHANKLLPVMPLQPIDPAKIEEATAQRNAHTGSGKFFYNDKDARASLLHYTGTPTEAMLDSVASKANADKTAAMIVNAIETDWEEKFLEGKTDLSAFWFLMIIHIFVLQRLPDSGVVQTVDAIAEIKWTELESLFGMQLTEAQLVEKDKKDAFFNCTKEDLSVVANQMAAFFRQFFNQWKMSFIVKNDVMSAMKIVTTRNLDAPDTHFVTHLRIKKLMVDVWSWCRESGIPVTRRVVAELLNRRSLVGNAFVWEQKRSKCNVHEPTGSFVNVATAALDENEDVSYYMMVQKTATDETNGYKTVHEKLQPLFRKDNDVVVPIDLDDLNDFVKSWGREWGINNVNVFVFGIRNTVLANTKKLVRYVIADMKQRAATAGTKRERDDADNGDNSDDSPQPAVKRTGGV